MKRTLILAACAVLIIGCNNEGVVTGIDIASMDTAVDAAVDVAAPEVSAPDTAGPDTPAPEDLESTDLAPACAPGDGCFLDHCAGNEDCQSGWCVEHMGEGVCTRTCQTECPDGWSCQQVAGTDPDLVYVCVSAYANLCKPCASGAGCVSPAGADDACVAYDDGAFCGGACGIDGTCPWGFSCKEIETVDGVTLSQCVSDAGVCPCTEKSVALGLWTPCDNENDEGICAGKRVCTDDGLSDCDAAEPTFEICNGADDDCDGDTDEPLEIGGDFVNICDDDNDCTDDVCTGEAGCTHEVLQGDECVDGNPCTVADHCEDGVCVGAPVTCDDDDPCTEDTCAADGGCVFTPASGPCDDGDPCTVGDYCDDGTCSGVAVDCACTVDEDCEALEDGDICTGTLFCDTDVFPFACTVVPDTVIQCPAPEGPGGVCLQAVCDAETGECGVAPDHEGFSCDDGVDCTVGDTCVAGECLGGPALDCDDNDPCTADICDPAIGCVYTLTNLPCDDGDVCTLGDICQNGACAGAESLDCDDDNPCTTDSCDPATGCQHVAFAGACDDGNPCTLGDHCDEGLCVSDGIEECDDGNPCTQDLCLPSAGCLHQAKEGPCDDGDPCTINDFCDASNCTPGAQVSCEDGNPCTDDACVNGLCQNSPAEAACDDGNQCTTDDLCADGACVGGDNIDCDDGDACTTEYCDPIQGCQFILNSEPCDDGNPCTANDLCSQGICIPGDPANCDDGNPCTDDGCLTGVGCTYALNTAPCDDGNPCTTEDICSAATCIGGLPLVCEDDNPCTDNTCDPLSGCDFLANEAPCDDGDECTLGDICENGACVSAEILECDDGNPCTTDLCDAEIGCSYTEVANGTPCGEPGEQCWSGQCITGDPAMVLYYNFESAAGPVPDLGISGNPTPGEMHGTVGYHNEGKYGDWALRSPQGSGANDYMDITGTLTDLDMTGDGYSFMAWIKVLSGGSQGLLVLGSCCSPRDGYTLNLSATDTIRYWAGQTNNDDNHNLYANNTFVDGQWHHVGARVNNGTVQILINGVTKGSNSEAALPSSPSKVNSNNDHAPHAPHIGGQGISNTFGADVLIDEVRIYNKYLSDDEWAAAMGGL